MKLSPTLACATSLTFTVDYRPPCGRPDLGIGIAVEGISGEGANDRLRNGDRNQSPRRDESLRRSARGVGAVWSRTQAAEALAAKAAILPAIRHG